MAAPPPPVTFARDAKVEDDAASAPYVSASPAADAALPPAVRSKRAFFFSTVPAELHWRLQVDEVALYSITEAHVAQRQAQALLAALEASLGGGAGARAAARAARVTDACACVGGNVLAFAAAFAAVTAVEWSPQRARMLANNARVAGARVALGSGFAPAEAGALAALGAALPPPHLPGHVTVLCGDYAAPGGLAASLAQDAVFLDPPWGGPQYGEAAALDMFLGAVDVAELIVGLTGGGGALPRARVVALKAPRNYNTPGLAARLAGAGGHASITATEVERKMQLIVVSTGRAGLARLDAAAAAATAAAAAAAGSGGGERKRPREDGGNGGGGGGGSSTAPGAPAPPASRPAAPAAAPGPPLYIPGPPGSAVAWQPPAGKETLPCPPGAVAVGLELLLPLGCHASVPGARLTADSPRLRLEQCLAERAGEDALASASAQQQQRTLQQLLEALPTPSLFSSLCGSPPSCLPSPQLLQALQHAHQRPGAAAPLVGSGLFLRVDSAGNLVLAANSPEVFLLAQAAATAAAAPPPASASAPPAPLAIHLRTSYSGIVRACSDGVRLACRSTKPPAPSLPSPAELLHLLHLPWGAGGAGACVLAFPNCGGRVLGVTAGSAAGGAPLSVVQALAPGPGEGGTREGAEPLPLPLPLPPALTQLYAALDPATGLLRPAAPFPALFRPIFRDSLAPYLLPAAGEAAGGSAAPPAPLALLAALGVPTCVPRAAAAAAAATAPAAASGERSKVLRVAAAAPWLPTAAAGTAATLAAVVKVQTWDTRVPREACSLQRVAALLATLPDAAHAAAAVTPVPLALLRDAGKVYQVLPDRGQDAVAAAAGGSSSGGGGSSSGSSSSSSDSSALAVCAAAAALTGALIFQALGMLHADIHARNVLVAWEGGGAHPPRLRLSLCDFGSALPLARAPAGAPLQQLCYTGAPRGGRWDAMPLEQFGSGRHANEGAVTLTPASDVFSAGVVLASLWRGRGGVMPFAEEAGGGRATVAGTRGHARRAPGALSLWCVSGGGGGGGMGAALRQWLDAATHPEAGQRPGDAAAALAGLLQACSADEAGGGGAE